MTITNKMLRLVITTSIATAIVFAETAYSADSIFADAEVVEFESVSFTYTPSPFKVKQAKKLGIPVEVKTEPSVSLTGYLARPAGEEPRPQSFSFIHVSAFRGPKKCGLTGSSAGATLF